MASRYLAPVHWSSRAYFQEVNPPNYNGVFEHPNYENDNFPGPLSDGNPFPIKEAELYPRTLVNDTLWNILDQTSIINAEGPKGPLLAISLALFGEGSYADIDHTKMAAYAHSNATFPYCIGAIPLISLLGENTRVSARPFDPCLSGKTVKTSYWQRDDASMQEYRFARLHANVATYFSLLSGSRMTEPDDQAEIAFVASAFLAHDVMMTNPAQDRKVISLQYAFGADMQIPSISTTGITLISVLLALYLICLLAMLCTAHGILDGQWLLTLSPWCGSAFLYQRRFPFSQQIM